MHDVSLLTSISIILLVCIQDEMKLSHGTGLSAGEWADSLTNISVGDLLSGVSQDLEDNCIDHPIAENCHNLHQIPFSSDSFDAAIAAHISRHQDKMGQPTLASHMSSIWDAEETCDAFLFKKDPIPHEDGSCLSPIASLDSEKLVPGRSSECTEKLDKVVFLNLYSTKRSLQSEIRFNFHCFYSSCHLKERGLWMILLKQTLWIVVSLMQISSIIYQRISVS